MNKYYNTELEVIGDVLGIFCIIPDEIIETPYFTDKYGLPTSNHEQAINNLPFKQTVYRLANSDEDFEIVFEKRFSLSRNKDREIFLKRHIEAFQAREDEIKLFKAETLESEHEIIAHYLKYLRTKEISIKALGKRQNKAPTGNPPLIDNIYNLFNFVGINLNNVMTYMTKIPFNIEENDRYFVANQNEGVLIWRNSCRYGCNIIVAHLLNELADRLRRDPKNNFTVVQLKNAFVLEFSNFNIRSIEKSRDEDINTNYKIYVDKILTLSNIK